MPDKLKRLFLIIKKLHVCIGYFVFRDNFDNMTLTTKSTHKNYLQIINLFLNKHFCKS